jgi:sugar phosphate isomerase/epimerase
MEFWHDFLSDKDPNIRIHLENMLELDPELISDVVRSIDRANLDINLDIGHAHCNSNTPVIKWIERLGSQIGYVHLHDNHGQSDEHLGLGPVRSPSKKFAGLWKNTPRMHSGQLKRKGKGFKNPWNGLESMVSL